MASCHSRCSGDQACDGLHDGFWGDEAGSVWAMSIRENVVRLYTFEREKVLQDSKVVYRGMLKSMGIHVMTSLNAKAHASLQPIFFGCGVRRGSSRWPPAQLYSMLLENLRSVSMPCAAG